MSTEKSMLRTTLLSARRSVGPATRSAAAGRLLAALRELLVTVRPASLAGYAPFGNEPGGSDLPAMLSGAVGRVLFPVVLPDLDLDWAEPPLAAGPRGFREPTGPRLGPAAVGTVDLVIVPALAVDAEGVRLGRGGGSYDRALARVPMGVPIVALLHDGELLDTLPAEPHDRRVTGVITPSGGFHCLPRHPD